MSPSRHRTLTIGRLAIRRRALRPPARLAPQCRASLRASSGATSTSRFSAPTPELRKKGAIWSPKRRLALSAFHIYKALSYSHSVGSHPINTRTGVFCVGREDQIPSIRCPNREVRITLEGELGELVGSKIENPDVGCRSFLDRHRQARSVRRGSRAAISRFRNRQRLHVPIPVDQDNRLFFREGRYIYKCSRLREGESRGAGTCMEAHILKDGRGRPDQFQAVQIHW